jgi:hypothetical protein
MFFNKSNTDFDFSQLTLEQIDKIGLDQIQNMDNDKKNNYLED